MDRENLWEWVATIANPLQKPSVGRHLSTDFRKSPEKPRDCIPGSFQPCIACYSLSRFNGDVNDNSSSSSSAMTPEEKSPCSPPGD